MLYLMSVLEFTFIKVSVTVKFLKQTKVKNMKTIMMIICIFTLSGCALTEFAQEYFNSAVDVNQYEAAKEVDTALCDVDVLARLQKTRSAKWYNETVLDCQKRKEQAVPLSN